MTTPSKEQQLGWLAGIIDGEGSIGVYFSRENPQRYLMGVTIVNTDMAILNKAKQILESLGIQSTICEKSASKKFRIGSFRHTKSCYEVVVRKREHLTGLLNVMVHLLVGEKRKKAEDLLEFIRLHPRKVRPKKYCGVCTGTITKRGARYCSQKCWHQYATGSANPNWRHGEYVVPV